MVNCKDWPNVLCTSYYQKVESTSPSLESGLGNMTCFSQWITSKSDSSRGLKKYLSMGVFHTLASGNTKVTMKEAWVATSWVVREHVE